MIFSEVCNEANFRVVYFRVGDIVNICLVGSTKLIVHCEENCRHELKLTIVCTQIKILINMFWIYGMYGC